MSIRLMSAVFESKTLGPTERLVMLALADHADDAGSCYPSIARLSDRTGLSERAVQTNIKKLVERGHVRIAPRGGRSGSNLYLVCANPTANIPDCFREPCTKCPPQQMRPADNAPQTPHEMRPNPAGNAPKPSEPSIVNVTEAAEERVRPDQAATHQDLILTILHALGFDRGQPVPKYWMGSDTPLIVKRWQADLGLTEAEIVAVAKQNAIQYGEPAKGPKILNRHMAAYAAAKREPQMRTAVASQANGSAHSPIFSPADLEEIVRNHERKLEAKHVEK